MLSAAAHASGKRNLTAHDWNAWGPHDVGVIYWTRGDGKEISTL